jgi:ribonuclease HI
MSPPQHSIVVFTDGAAKGNPGPGGWGAIVRTPDGRVTELGGGDPHTTNNRMELTGAIRALERLTGIDGEVDLYTDSVYVIRGIREWIRSWKRNGWRTAEGKDVLNRSYWERLDELVAQRGSGGRVHWHHVRGHADIPGNERADDIASDFALGRRPELYRGAERDYDVPLSEVPSDTSPPSRRSGGRPSGAKSAPYSYVSVVDGRAMRHATWSDCERRVKGRSGARFKKATSAADEAAILASWGFSPADL